MAHWPERTPATLANAVEIDKRSALSPEETMGRYLAGEGRPVVVTDAQKDWKAAKLWSLDYFKKHYADEQLIASDRAPLRHEDNPRMQTLRTTLGEVKVEVFCEDTPKTAENFLALCASGVSVGSSASAIAFASASADALASASSILKLDRVICPSTFIRRALARSALVLARSVSSAHLAAASASASIAR